MPKKKIDIIKDLSLEKNQFIVERLEKFEELINSSAFILSEIMVREFIDQLESDNGELKNTSDNVRKVNLIEKAWQNFQEQQGFRIINTFVSDLKEIVALGQDYYTELIPEQVASERIEAIINQKLGIKWDGKHWEPVSNGYVSSLMNDRTVVTDLKKIAYNNVIAKAGPNALRKSFDNYIIGKEGEPGEFNQFFKQFAFDTYSQVDRLNSSMHADRLKLKYFLYNGGVIKDSREFCVRHHGKCFSVDEAEGWRDLIGKYELVPGKRKALVKVPIGPIVEDPLTYEPVRDLGGILCRHSADFVSDEIAKELRKNQVNPDE